jgi:RNA polymerase sigma-70 factor (ECF subfamily)
MQFRDCWRQYQAGHAGDLLRYVWDRMRQRAHTMLRTEFARLRRWEETDDVLLSATVRLWQALKQVQPATEKDFLGLAALQVRRELLDLARHYYGPEGLGANHASWSGGVGVPLGDHADDTGELAALAEWAEFHRQVGELPQEEREVVGLLWYLALTQEEAAEMLGVSVRTLQYRWQRARVALHRALRGRWPGR